MATPDPSRHGGPRRLTLVTHQQDETGMSADDAAWAMIADAAEAALTLPGLSPIGCRLVGEAAASCRAAAGLLPQNRIRS